MTPKQNAEKKMREMCGLSDDQLAMVVGGNRVAIGTQLPNWHGPKYGPPSGSIAAGEINSNALDNNLPDSGGGIVV
jgi:hypothetical protein